MPNRKLNVFLCHAKEDKPTVRDFVISNRVRLYPTGGKMPKHLHVLLTVLVATTMFLSACGPGQFLGPTLTPTLTITPLPTATYTPSPTNTLTPTLTLTPTPALGVGNTWNSPADGMTMLYIPAGEFTMGSDTGDSDEKPVHTIYLDSYWIDQTEVTNAMYAKCVQAGVCKQPIRTTYYDNSEYTDHPVVYVSWNDAKAYCEWRDDGTRLPTEAEWEKAAGWDDTKKEKRVYPWGNDLPNSGLLNFNQNIGDTTEVGTYPNGASFYGVLDMAGNVWEWVSSLYQSYPYSANDGRENLSANGERVLRGGSDIDSVYYVRSSSRPGLNPGGTVKNIGFRCSRSP